MLTCSSVLFKQLAKTKSQTDNLKSKIRIWHETVKCPIFSLFISQTDPNQAFKAHKSRLKSRETSQNWQNHLYGPKEN